MKCKWDFSEFYEFAEKLENDNTIETAYMTATRNIAKALHGYLLQLTPVDTGNLRKMWSAGDNLMFYVDRVEGGFQVTLVNAAQRADGYKYGWVVNYGHTTPNGGWVMGRFFVENSVAAVEEKSKEIIMKELRKWFKGCIHGK